MVSKQFVRWPQRFVLLAAIVGTLTTYPRTISAQASEFTDNQFVPFSLMNEGCGDVMFVSGTLHILTHVTLNASGGLTMKQHHQGQGVTGVGMVSGAQYQTTGVTQFTATDNGPGPQFEFTYIDNFHMISTGTTPNFDVHVTIHTTINNNGEVTATVENESIECRG